MSEYNSKLTIGVNILVDYAFSHSDLDVRQCFFNELDGDDDFFEGMCETLELKPTDSDICMDILEQVVTDVRLSGVFGYDLDDKSEAVIIPVVVTIDDELLKELNQDEVLLRKYAREGSMIAVTVSEEADLHTEKTVYSSNANRNHYYMEKWLEDAMGEKTHPVVAEVSRDSIIKDLLEFKSKMGKDDKVKILDVSLERDMKKGKGDIER